MTNYDCYFGTEERAIDSLTILLESNHPRKEVIEFQKEVYKTGIAKWLKGDCTNQRWWSEVFFNK